MPNEVVQIGEPADVETLCDRLRARLIESNRLTAANPTAPGVVRLNARLMVVKLPAVDIDIDSDGTVIVDSEHPEMDYFTITVAD
jgi:hypothetical protein